MFLMNNNMNILIYGGSFNPLTIAHKSVSKALYNKFKLDKLIFLPTSTNFIKNIKKYNSKDIIKEEERINLLNDFINESQEDYNFEISLLEINNVTFKSYDSLMYFRNNLYPKDIIYFGMGDEKLLSFYKWYKVEEILKNFKIVIIKRLGLDLESLFKIDLYKRYKDQFIFFDPKINLSNISSTSLRNNKSD